MHQLHRDEADGSPVELAFVRLVDHGDIGMAQRRRGPGLGEQSRRPLTVRTVATHDLQRNRALQSLVLGAIHLAHGAGAEALDDPVA